MLPGITNLHSIVSCVHLCVFLGLIQQADDQETEDSVEEEGEEDDTESDLVCSSFYLMFIMFTPGGTPFYILCMTCTISCCYHRVVNLW